MEYAFISKNPNSSVYEILEIFPSMPNFYKLEIKEENKLSEEELKSMNIFPVDDNLPIDYDEFKYNLELKNFKYWTFDATAELVYKQYNTTEYTFAERKELLIQELAAKRYEHEIAGITIDGNIVATDRSSQAMLNSAVRVLELDPSKTINWKCENCWVELDATSISLISQCVIDYVEKCFNNEMMIWNQIDNVADNDWESLKNIDLNAGWPSSVYNT